MKQSGDNNRFHHLHEAYSSFKKKNYINAVIILDKLKDTGREDSYTLFLLAVSQLYSNNFTAANSLMERIQRLSPSYTPFIQLKAFLALKSSASREGAISAYISALEKNSSDRLLRKGLHAVESASDFYRYQKGVKISDLVYIPKPGKKDTPPVHLRFVQGAGMRHLKRKYLSIRPVYGFFFLLMVAVFAAGFIYFSGPGIPGFFTKDESPKLNSDVAAKIDMIDISGSGYGFINRINKEKTPEFYTSGDVLINDFNEAKTLIKKGSFNKAVIILNRILNSNAGFPVKEKSEFLVKFIMDSDQREYETIDLKKISEKPYLFRGSGVKFTGRAANVRELKGATTFSLMVGYDGNNFNGICEVYDPARSDLKSGDIVEVQGLFVLNVGKNGTPYISSEKLRIVRSKNG